MLRVTALRCNIPVIVVFSSAAMQLTPVRRAAAYAMAAKEAGADGLRWECACGASIWAPFDGPMCEERPS